MLRWIFDLFKTDPSGQDDDELWFDIINKISPSERGLVRNVLDLRDQTIKVCMKPASDIIALQRDSRFEDVLDIVGRRAHSRYPVYGETLDDMLGFVHIKDLFKWLGRSEEKNLVKRDDFDLKTLLQPAEKHPDTIRVIDLLRHMQESRTHLVFVVDEYGGVSGLVTIEDLVEEIVGEIIETTDPPIPQVIEESHGSLLIDAAFRVDEFEELFGRLLDIEDKSDDEAGDTHGDKGENSANGIFDTMGGLVLYHAGYLPARGEIIAYHGLEFEITAVDSRRLRQFRLINPEKLAVPKT